MKIAAWKAGLFGALALTSIGTVARADDAPWGPFSATVNLTSDYRFRGQSQTDRDPAIQGSIDYTHASGFFAGVWGSNVDFNDYEDTSVEIDLYAGYGFTLTEGWDATVKAVYYWYPDSGDFEYDYWEFIGGVSHDFGKFSVTGEIAYSPDFFAETGDAIALTGGASVPISATVLDGLSASGHVGYQWIDENGSYGTPDYFYWDLGLSVAWGIFTFDARYIDTDIDKSDCYGGADICEGTAVFSVAAALPGE